ncbi:Fc.00g055690.m01.CDS01 [Cosmosporella sp. VM-42]
MCLENTATLICKVPTTYYTTRRTQRPSIWWCFDTKVAILGRLYELNVSPTTIEQLLVNEEHMLNLARLCNLEPAIRANSQWIVPHFKDLVRWACRKLAVQVGALKLSAGEWAWDSEVASKDPFQLRDRLQQRLRDGQATSIGSLADMTRSLSLSSTLGEGMLPPVE